MFQIRNTYTNQHRDWLNNLELRVKDLRSHDRYAGYESFKNQLENIKLSSYFGHC